MTLSLTEAKEFLRIDHDLEDTSLSSLILASEKFILNATHQNADKTDELFKHAQRLLVGHWYESREVVGKADALAFSLQSILIQISYTSSDVE
ncbi:head-tail connector protein [Cytobacillus firmus]|uniref:head-tail connector protein n=1 Tax=Cytobacillus firmus TaxID=1399 RepID=UPI0018CD0634|nr:head-tail connector protein [Cytobacillus firmus]MBG9657091.1 DNA-packaging protein [Cytobacillus firmus]MED1906764.1 head-tail connector protein [Cytobacillus firmus]